MAISVITKLPIHETFQNTVQGEGFWTGTHSDFIRLFGCPVRCHWCDTGYADGGKKAPRSLTDIDILISELKSPRVIVSGGEPMIHPAIAELTDRIIATGRDVAIETSGSFWQPVSPDVWITLSPKEHLNSDYPVLESFWSRANEIKIVIETGDEWEFYKDKLNPSMLIYLQPEWNSREISLQKTIKLVQENNVRLSLQIHKFIGVR